MSPPALLDRLEAAGARVAGLAQRSPQGARVPDSQWTVGDVLAHLSAGMDAYARYLEGDPTPLLDVSDLPGGSLRASNAAVLAGAADRDPARLTDRLTARLGDVLTLAAGRDLDSGVPWHGREERLRTVLAVGLGELLVHGLDLARATGTAWEIEPADARLVLGNIGDLLPLLVDPGTAGGLTATIEVRLRGSGPAEPPIVLTFSDGRLSVGPGPAPRARRADQRGAGGLPADLLRPARPVATDADGTGPGLGPATVGRAAPDQLPRGSLSSRSAPTWSRVT